MDGLALPTEASESESIFQDGLLGSIWGLRNLLLLSFEKDEFFLFAELHGVFFVILHSNAYTADMDIQYEYVTYIII